MSEPSIEELVSTIAGLAEAVKGQQKVLDAFKTDIKTLKAPKPEAVETSPLESTVAELKRQNELLLKQNEERATRERETHFNLSLNKELLNAGVKANLIDHANAYLKQTGAAKMEEDGSIKISVDGIFKPLTSGAKEWAKTDSAKLYLAEKGTKGSGMKNPTTEETGSEGEGPISYSSGQLEQLAREALGI